LESAIPVLIRHITEQQGAFAQSVEEVLANVRFPAAVAEASSRSNGFFRDLVAWGGEGGPGLAVESAASQRIDLLKAKYTMESERHAHAAALEPVLAPADAPASQPSVELFGELEPQPPAATGSLGEIAPQSEAPDDPPRPADAVAGNSATPALEPALASEKLGDNVELF